MNGLDGIQLTLHSLEYLLLHENDAVASDMLFERIGRSSLATTHSKFPLSNREQKILLQAPDISDSVYT